MSARKPLLFRAFLGLAFAASWHGSAQAAGGWAENWFDTATYTSPSSFSDQQRGYVTAGGMSGRINVTNDYLATVSLPKINAGCGGVDMFLGGMSFLDPDYLVQKLENILQAAPAVAFQYLLETLDEKMGNIISKMEAATNYLNSIQVNDCRLANRMVTIARGKEGMDGLLEEMTGDRSIKAGFDRHRQAAKERIQANKGNPTEDLKDRIDNCPAEVRDIFRTGSLLGRAASRVGAGAAAGVMRARVGDVYLKWDPVDKLPEFTPIPACAKTDTDTLDDFLIGNVQTRAVSRTPSPTDCTDDDTGNGARQLARARMVAIANRMRLKQPLTAEERLFLENVRVLPLYHMLELGVRRGVQGSVIDDTDEVVGVALAYNMLNDLLRAIDYIVNNAERVASSAKSADPNNPLSCDMRIVGDGLEDLRRLGVEVTRQRSEMKVAYYGALGRANLGVQYATFFRQSDREARDRDGRFATPTR